jgi:hypothetical protein
MTDQWPCTTSLQRVVSRDLLLVVHRADGRTLWNAEVYERQAGGGPCSTPIGRACNQVTALRAAHLAKLRADRRRYFSRWR